MYTPFAYPFAYAIKQTPYAFVAKIILCMYLLYGWGAEHTSAEGATYVERSGGILPRENFEN